MASLCTIADIEARLGRSLTVDEAVRVQAMLDDASALIRAYTGQSFDLVTDDEITLRPVGTHLRLPQRPVLAVDSVVAVGCGTIPDITLPEGTWCWDGIDLVNVWPDNTWILNLPETWADGDGPDTYRIVYDHGHATVPADVQATCCAMVLRSFTSPTLAENMRGETIGQYSYQFAGDGSAGGSVRLLDVDKDALKRYRRTQSSISTRIR